MIRPTRPSTLAAIVCTCLLADPAGSQDWDPFGSEDVSEPEITAEFSGLLYGRWNSDLKNDLNGEQTQEFRGKANLHLSLDHPDYGRMVVSALGAYDAFPGQDRNPARFKPELWEAYWTLERTNWELSAGQMIRRWGRGVPSLWDNLNPGDFSEFLFTEDEFVKLPVPMARWTRYGDSYELELIAIPFYRGARMPGNNSDWAFISVNDLSGAEDFPFVEQAVDQDLSPGLVTDPADNFVNGDFGIRFAPAVKGFDLDLHILLAHEDLPLPAFTPDFVTFLQAEQARGISPLDTLRSLALQEIATFSPIFVQKPQRQLSVGGSIAVPLPSVVARFELAALSQQRLYSAGMEVVRAPAIQTLVGVDALSGERFLYTLSFIGSAFLTDSDLFLVDRFNVSASGLARARPWDVDLWIEVRTLWNINLGDAWIGPALIYDFANGLQLQAGVNILAGPGSAPLSQFDDNDFAWARARYVF